MKRVLKEFLPHATLVHVISVSNDIVNKSLKASLKRKKIG